MSADVVTRGWGVLGRADLLPASPGHQEVNAAKATLTAALLQHSRLTRADMAPGDDELTAAVAEATDGVIEAVRKHYADSTAIEVAGETGEQ